LTTLRATAQTAGCRARRYSALAAVGDLMTAALRRERADAAHSEPPPTSNPPASVHRRVRKCFSSVVYRHMRPASPLPDNRSARLRPSAQPNGCKPRWKATKRPFAAGSSARGLLGRRCAARAQTAAPVPTGSRCADQQSHELTASHSRLSSTTTRPDYQMIAHTALWRMRQNPPHGNLGGSRRRRA